jgi:hypothetical protein
MADNSDDTVKSTTSTKVKKTPKTSTTTVTQTKNSPTKSTVNSTTTTKTPNKTITTTTKSTAVKAAKGGGHALAYLAAAVIIIILILAALALYNSSISANWSKLPYFAKSTQAVPPAFQANVSTGSLATLARVGLSKSSQFTAQYAGIVHLKPSGVGSLTTFSSPINYGIYKYNNDVKLAINATGIPVLGTRTIVYVNPVNGSAVTCTNFKTTANLTCTHSDSVSGINLTQLSSWDISSALSSYGITLDYQTTYQSIYNGVPCTFLSGTITLNGQPGSGIFEECVSDTLYVPLSYSAYFSGASSGTIAFNLNETAIGNYSQSQYVGSVPGPIS